MTKQIKICKITGSLIGNQPEIDKLIAGAHHNLIIDFSDCAFISVPGLEWLKEMLSKAGAAGINVTYVAIPPALYKVFKVARIDSILPLAAHQLHHRANRFANSCYPALLVPKDFTRLVFMNN